MLFTICCTRHLHYFVACVVPVDRYCFSVRQLKNIAFIERFAAFCLVVPITEWKNVFILRSFKPIECLIF
jgi:hypothetical protein